MQRLISHIYNHILRIENNKNFFKNQKNTFSMPQRKIKQANRTGFTIDEYVIYELDKNNASNYISEKERLKFREALGSKKLLLDNKVIFHKTFKDCFPMNKMFCYKFSGEIIAIDDNVTNYDEILNILENTHKIVLKQINAGGGNGFHLFEYNEGKYFDNNKEITREDILDFLVKQSEYLIEEYCEQNDFENSICPFAINTIRIITARHKNRKYEILGAVHRFGGFDSSVCVDNASAGGVFSEINIDTGKLSSAHTYVKDYVFDSDGKINDFDFHPITNYPLKECIVPDWNRIKENVLQYHKNISFSNIDFVAWDLALTNNGITVIEANASTGFRLFQMFNGQRNTKLGEWFKEWGYIK